MTPSYSFSEVKQLIILCDSEKEIKALDYVLWMERRRYDPVIWREIWQDADEEN